MVIEAIKSKSFGETVNVSKLIKELNICSRSEAQRLIKQGGVEIDGEKVGKEAYILDGSVLRVGKRTLKRLRLPAREVTIERTRNQVEIIEVGGFVNDTTD